MTEVFCSPSSSSYPSISTPNHDAALFHNTQACFGDDGVAGLSGDNVDIEEEKNASKRRDQLSLVAILVALFRKSFGLACKDDFSCGDSRAGARILEIGWPTDVRHVNHVTFDRFNGFLGLPVEFEPEVYRRAPSASTTVFGVSTESMQLSYDARGNSIPVILLLMQRHLYSQGGLQAEGIFRITAGNIQEEFVRDQLNRGLIPDGIDVHCLASLIKAWFRELPRGVLDSLSPEQVIQCQSEEDCDSLVRLLPSTEAALLDWAINLMADVVQAEELNKMNAHNIAMVFAPNMTQMADPLTALIYAVQVMNFLKTLVEKTLREREASITEPDQTPSMGPSDDNGHQSSSGLRFGNPAKLNRLTVQSFLAEDPGSKIDSESNLAADTGSDCDSESNSLEKTTDNDYLSYSASTDESDDNLSCETHAQVLTVISANKSRATKAYSNHFEESIVIKTGTLNGDSSQTLESKSVDLCIELHNKNMGISNLSLINSETEKFEAWR